MYNYYLSNNSKSKLDTTHHDLQMVIYEAITNSPIDFGVSSGLRTADEQNVLYNKGLSKCDGFIKKSNHQDGLAVDIYAYVGGKASYDIKHLCVIAGHIIGTAKRLGVEVRCGGDWDGDWDFDDQDLIDWPHFELVDK